MVDFFEKFCRRYLRRRGWAVAPISGVDRNGEYFLYSYSDPGGAFNYQRYCEVQIEGNKRKITNVWADHPTIEVICSYLAKTNARLQNGLCHGSRNGTEVNWFREITGADVEGTDISDTANQFEHLTQWDFHERNPEWIGKFDFVYTNAHDHAYDPKKAIDAWIEQLKPRGALFIEHTMAHSETGTNELDPFGVRPTIFPYLLLKWGNGNYAATEVLEPAHTKPNGLKIWVFVVRKLRT